MIPHFWLDDLGRLFVLHAFGRAGEERMQIFPGKWSNAQGKWIYALSISLHHERFSF